MQIDPSFRNADENLSQPEWYTTRLGLSLAYLTAGKSSISNLMVVVRTMREPTYQST